MSSYRPLIAFSLLACLGLPSFSLAWAGSDFGAGWEARPLVDTSAPSKAAQPAGKSASTSTTPAAPSPAVLEAKLKPVEPFIQDVEKQLFLKPPGSAGLVERLNTLQTVLFGEQKYQDAGELLGKLAEIFPQAAAKQEALLSQQLKNSVPPALASAKPVSKSSQGKAVVSAPATQPGEGPQTISTASSSGKPVKQKKSLFHDDFDSAFDNDPFFNDNLNARQTGQVQQQAYQNSSPAYGAQTQAQQGPSKLSSVAQGLAGLAMVAGGVAGAYFLNKNSGNHGFYPNNNGYYGNGYGYNPYYNGYGYNTGAYGYGQPYYGNPYNYYGGGGVTYQPYTNMPGTTTYGLGSISPLGVQTGIYP